MDVLQPVIRPYAWGSRTGIAALQGRPVPSAGPEAELWMGAHPSAPSVISRDGHAAGLDAVIAADPARELGQACAERFGGRLPFLLKVLSAEKALSIQLHPSAGQARQGFAREQAAGLSPRNYVDDWPKPELLCALTPFEVLAGLRTAADAVAFARELGAPALSGVLSRGPAGALAAILSWPAADLPGLVADVVAGYARVAAAGGEHAAAAAALLRVAADFPGDAGVVAAALLRYAVLAPGEAVFMPAGGLHAYLRGTGVEVLANSDNVVRAGLTSKHVDVPELLALLDPDVTVPVSRPVAVGPGLDVFDTPAPEFRLFIVAGAPVLPGAGARIVLCADGEALLRAAGGNGDAVKLGRGESCFVSAADGPVTVAGQARLFTACAGSCA